MARIRLLIIISFILFSTGCSSNRPESKMVVINYWTTSNKDTKQLELELIMSFQKKNPYISVIRKDYNSKDYVELLYSAFNSDNAPDIFNLAAVFSMPLITNGHLEPLNISLLEYKNIDDLIKKYIPRSFHCANYQNQIYGLPMEVSNLCLVVIDNSFKGNIKTFEDFLGYSKMKPKTEGMDGNIASYLNISNEQPIFWFSAMIHQLGGKIIIPELKRCSINNEAGKYLFKYLSEFRDGNLENPFNISPGSKIFFCNMKQIYQAIKENPDIEEKIRVFRFPRFKTRIFDNGSDLYLKYFYVNSHSDLAKRKASWMLADWLTSHPFRYLKGTGIIEANKKLFKNYFKDPIPFCDKFIEDIENCSIPEYLHDFKRINSTVNEFISHFFNSKINPSEAAEMLQNEIDNILK